MTATKPKKQVAEKEETPEKLPTNVTEQEVLSRLGKPSDLHSVDVHRYDTSRCRVNVKREMNKEAAEAHFRHEKMKKPDIEKMLSGIDHSMTRSITLITDSFYLRTNYDGSIRSDSELIERRY